MKTEVEVKPNMLTWAISRAGFELSEFVSKFPKVGDWLEKKKKPTVKQLEEFSNRVHIPFGYLFLNEPPQEQLPIPFFRTGTSQTNEVSINVYDTILLIQRRQEWLSSYLRENDFERLPFVGRARSNNSYVEIVEDIRRTLQLDSEWASRFKTLDETLAYLTDKIEELGIIISFNGVVENNTSRPIKVEECRGFVLVDEWAPFMFVNAADAKAAQLFTIVHELAHIWTGHSAGFDIKKLMPANDPIEKLCDQVAAEFLVPADSFNRLWRQQPDIRQIAKYFKVSPIVIGRRAWDLGKIGREEFFNFYDSYISQLELKKENQGSGGDFYATTRKRLSPRFAGLINQAVKNESLLYRDAYRLTGLKGDTFHTFFSDHLIK